MDDSTPPHDADGPDKEPLPTDRATEWVENTNPYERALSALLVPRGDRLTEIADRNAVDPDIVREVASRFVHQKQILIESDGKRTDPRLHRNYVLDFFTDVWGTFSRVDSKQALIDWHDTLVDEINAYESDTGYENPGALVDAIRDPDTDLSHIDTPDTDEFYWDYVSPWRNLLHQKHLVEFALDNYDTLSEVTDFIDIENPGPYGDFAAINAIDAKLGLEDQPPTDAEIDDNGELHGVQRDTLSHQPPDTYDT